MRKLMPLLLLLALLAGCSSGCTGQTIEEGHQPALSPSPAESAGGATPAGPSPTPTPAPAATAVPTAQVTPPEQPTPSPAPTPSEAPELSSPPPQAETPTDEEVLTAYRKAEEAFGWFALGTMPSDPTDTREVEGITYFRVDHPDFDTLAGLRGYLKGLFSDALVEQLLPYDGKQYLDLDGRLYVQDGGRGADVTKGAEMVQVLSGEDPGRRTVRVNVEVLDPEQDYAVVDTLVYDFPYELVGNRWIFTSFSMVR